MPDYRITIMRDGTEIESGEGTLTASLTVAKHRPGNMIFSWPRKHVGAREMLRGISLGEDPRRWQVWIVPVGKIRPAGVGMVTSLTLNNGKVEGFNKDSITAIGTTMLGVLNAPFSYVDPTTDSSTTTPSSWSSYADTIIGTKESIIRYLIARNISSTAPISRRRMNNLDVAVIPGNTGLGALDVFSRRFSNLLEAIRLLTLGTNIKADIMPSTDGRYQLEITENVLRKEIQWSFLTGTLKGIAATWTSADATSVLVGGAGEGVARVFLRVDGPAPDVGPFAYPREIFRGGSTENNFTDLRNAGLEDLADRGVSRSVKINPVEQVPYVLTEDFEVGDTVPVVVNASESINDTIPLEAPIDSVTLSKSNPSGWATRPTLGPPIGSGARQQELLLRDLKRAGRL